MNRQHTDPPCAVCASDSAFLLDLTALLIKYDRGMVSNTREVVLAEHLVRCLMLFEVSSRARSAMPSPVQT